MSTHNQGSRPVQAGTSPTHPTPTVDQMVSDFRELLREQGTINVLGQEPVHGRPTTVDDLHSDSVAAYRLGLIAGMGMR